MSTGPLDGGPLGIVIPEYLRSLGFDPKRYYDNVNGCFEDAGREHFVRLIVRELIAEREGLDIAGEEGTAKVWKRAAHEIYRGKWEHANTNGGRWAEGKVDPELATLLGYFGPDTIPLAQLVSRMPQDAAAPWQMAVARTLTYIRVLPPRGESAYLAPSARLRACWEDIRRHPHYREKANVNQHCLDEVQAKYGGCEEIVMAEGGIAGLKRAIEGREPDAEPWDTTWRIFTFIFTTPAIHRKDRLFDPRSKCYAAIWGP